MQNLLTVSLFFCFSQKLFSQIKIPVDSASKHVGEKVIICSEVFGLKQMEKVTFINVGAAYPNSPLTLVIFAKDASQFGEDLSEKYTHKKICVTGVVKEFKGKVEILVESPTQITMNN